MFDAWHDVRHVSDLALGLPATTYSEECVYKRCKVGDQPGFFAPLNSPNLAEAEKMIKETENSVGARSALAKFDLDIVPVNQFPHFS